MKSDVLNAAFLVEGGILFCVYDLFNAKGFYSYCC